MTARDLKPASSGRCISAAALLCAALLAAGCVKPLFPANATRSQFETYDIVRNQHAPEYFYDVYGRRTPNLRGRLGPKR